MPEEPRQDEELQDSEAASTLNRDFAGVLRSILESASEMFPSAEETDIRFSVALVGEMGSDKFVDLVNELPIVACIALRKEIGTKAALLTDAPTASALAGFVSEGKPTRKESLSDDDLVSLYDALSPILDALSNACEEATGHPLGAIESIEAVDPASPPPMLEGLSSELSERLCRATASVTIGNEDSGRLVLVLPRDLVKAMIMPKSADASVSPSEEADLQQEEIDTILSTAEPEEEGLPSQAEIDALMAQATEEPAPAVEEAAPQVAPPPSPPQPAPVSPAHAEPDASTKNIDLILDIQLKLTARLGKMEMSVGEIMKLSPGSVIDIDRFVDEPIELVVNDRLIARGDIVVVQENFGVKISEIVSPKERIQSLR